MPSEPDLDAVQTEYDSPYPECRVLATATPSALIRIDLTREQAAQFATDVRDAIRTHTGDSLVTLGITMQKPTYRRFATQIETLAEFSAVLDDEVASAQLLFDPAVREAGGISVAVILNDSQVQGIYERSQRDLQKRGSLHRWEWSVSHSGAVMLLQQLVAALNGADEPLDHVDQDDPRFDEDSEGSTDA